MWLFLWLVLFPFLGEETDWKLAKEKEGIKVYTRPVVGSDFLEFRAVTHLQVKPSVLVSIMKDADHYVEFMPDCTESKLLKTEGDTVQYNYTNTAVPWPLSDRDVINSFTYRRNKNTGVIRAISKGHPNYMEEKDGRVRVTKSDGGWTLEPQENGTLKVTYQLHIEPGGNIPIWLANYTVTDSPIQLILNMKKRLEMPQYQNKSYSFLE